MYNFVFNRLTYFFYYSSELGALLNSAFLVF